MIRHGAVVALALSAFGCSQLTESDGEVPVEMIAEFDAEAQQASLTIRNESADTVFLGWVCALGIQRKESSEWRALPVNCLAVGRPPMPIKPGEDLTFEQRADVGLEPGLDHLPEGEYRYHLPLMTSDDELLPEEARTSNTFRIE